MNGITYGLRDQAKTEETTTKVLGRPVGGTEVGTVLRPTTQYGERIAPGWISILYII